MKAKLLYLRCLALSRLIGGFARQGNALFQIHRYVFTENPRPRYHKEVDLTSVL